MIFIIVDWSGWTIEHVTFSLGNGKRQGTIIYDQQFNYIYASWSVLYLTQGTYLVKPCVIYCTAFRTTVVRLVLVDLHELIWKADKAARKEQAEEVKGLFTNRFQVHRARVADGGGEMFWRRRVHEMGFAWFCYVLLIDMWTILSFDGPCCMNPGQLWYSSKCSKLQGQISAGCWLTFHIWNFILVQSTQAHERQWYAVVGVCFRFIFLRKWMMAYSRWTKWDLWLQISRLQKPQIFLVGEARAWYITIQIFQNLGTCWKEAWWEDRN